MPWCSGVYLLNFGTAEARAEADKLEVFSNMCFSLNVSLALNRFSIFIFRLFMLSVNKRIFSISTQLGGYVLTKWRSCRVYKVDGRTGL